MINPDGKNIEIIFDLFIHKKHTRYYNYNFNYCMKTIKSIFSLLLLSALLLAVGCDNAVAPATETDVFETETEAATGTETGGTETNAPEKEDTRLSPVFSVKGGVYAEAQSLALPLPENAPEGAYITYTEDCSEPGKKSTKYENEIEVLNADTSVIRAACFDKDGERLGYIKTATYIKAEKGRFSIPVVSLVTEKKNLYGKKGIVDNPTKTGKDWERPCHVEIVMPDGSALYPRTPDCVFSAAAQEACRRNRSASSPAVTDTTMK